MIHLKYKKEAKLINIPLLKIRIAVIYVEDFDNFPFHDPGASYKSYT